MPLSALAAAEVEQLTSSLASKEEVGKRIRESRNERGLTQLELAQSVNKTRAAIAQWESGDTSPAIEIFPALASTLNKTEAYLAFGNVSNTRKAPDDRSSSAFVHASDQIHGDLGLLKAYFRSKVASTASIKVFLVHSATANRRSASESDLVFIDENAKTISGAGEQFLLRYDNGTLTVCQVISLPGSHQAHIHLFGTTMQVDLDEIKPLGQVIGVLKTPII